MIESNEVRKEWLLELLDDLEKSHEKSQSIAEANLITEIAVLINEQLKYEKTETKISLIE